LWNLSEGGQVKRKKKTPPQCLIRFRLNGLGSSQILVWLH
jgi:hypothetical protein